jgi:hypothetical protein
MYVGYLPLPPRLRRFLWVVAPVTIVGIAIAGVLLARTQPDPGSAVWESVPRTLTGNLYALPSPVLFAEDRGDGSPGPVLVVEQGKHGATRAAALHRSKVSLTGVLLRRDGQFLLELSTGDDAVRSLGAAPEPPPPVSLGAVALTGEIVDSKCYLGAMKPGHGKTHKECATLCISGGIPPLFVTRSAGRPAYYLIVGEAADPLQESLYQFIAEPVEVIGQAEEINGLLRLRVVPGFVRRL